MDALSQNCAHHPGRRGSALCMACRKVVCQECATKFEGVNYCRPCLALRGTSKRKSSAALWIACGLGAALALFAAGRAMAWTSGVLSSFK